MRQGMIAREALPPPPIEPSLIARYMVEMQTPYGLLGALGPVLKLSETPPHWSRPAAPLGASPAAWPEAEAPSWG